MHLQQEGEEFLVAFGPDDRRPVTEACRESMAFLADEALLDEHEARYSSGDMQAMLVLARFAIFAGVKNGEALPINSVQLDWLILSLKYFASPERMNRAINEEVRRAGILSNPRIESRVDLGRRAGIILTDLVAQRSSLSQNPAAKTLST
jgi:hypothetical protein